MPKRPSVQKVADKLIPEMIETARTGDVERFLEALREVGVLAGSTVEKACLACWSRKRAQFQGDETD